jgi:hypothetical protein
VLFIFILLWSCPHRSAFKRFHPLLKSPLVISLYLVGRSLRVWSLYDMASWLCISVTLFVLGFYWIFQVTWSFEDIEIRRFTASHFAILRASAACSLRISKPALWYLVFGILPWPKHTHQLRAWPRVEFPCELLKFRRRRSYLRIPIFWRHGCANHGHANCAPCQFPTNSVTSYLPAPFVLTLAN